MDSANFTSITADHSREASEQTLDGRLRSLIGDLHAAADDLKNMPQQRQESRRGELLVATHNPGKKREYRELLEPLEAKIRFPNDLDMHLQVRENGTTYAQNARKKAGSYARASGLLTLADDSGLEVDALGGAPGIHSARYVLGSDAERVQVLLSELRDIPWDERTARFRCVAAVVTRDGKVYEAEGVCEGMIAYEPAGEGGFGYDPIFYIPEYGKTMAQLSRKTKNLISHRARAVQAALPTLGRLLKESGRPLPREEGA